MGKNQRHDRQKPRRKTKAQSAPRRPESQVPRAQAPSGARPGPSKGLRPARKAPAAPPVERWASLEDPPVGASFLGATLGVLAGAIVPWIFLGGFAGFCAVEIINSSTIGPMRGDLITLGLAFGLIGTPLAMMGIALPPVRRRLDAAAAAAGHSLLRSGSARQALAEAGKALPTDEKPAAFLALEAGRRCTGDTLSYVVLFTNLIAMLTFIVLIGVSVDQEPLMALALPSALLLPAMLLELAVSSMAGIEWLSGLVSRVMPAAALLVVMAAGAGPAALVKSSPLVVALAVIQLLRGLSAIAGAPVEAALLVTSKGLRTLEIGPAGGIVRLGPAQVPVSLEGRAGPLPGDIALLDKYGREIEVVRPRLACLPELGKACKDAGLEVKVTGAQREYDFNESLDSVWIPWAVAATVGCATIAAPSLPLLHYGFKLLEATDRIERRPTDVAQSLAALARKYPDAVRARTALALTLSARGRRAEALAALADARAVADRLPPGLRSVTLENQLSLYQKRIEDADPGAGGP